MAHLWHSAERLEGDFGGAYSIFNRVHSGLAASPVDNNAQQSYTSKLEHLVNISLVRSLCTVQAFRLIRLLSMGNSIYIPLSVLNVMHCPALYLNSGQRLKGQSARSCLWCCIEVQFAWPISREPCRPFEWASSWASCQGGRILQFDHLPGQDHE